MNGLEIAKDFFFGWGRPFFESEFPALSKRIAAGRIFGSDVLGADDELSQDHNWGPYFDVFLSAEDFAEHGAALSEKINVEAPKVWKDYRLAGGGARSVSVHSIPKWFDQHFGFSKPFHDALEWQAFYKSTMYSTDYIEGNLYMLRHGVTWVDGTGEFSQWRQALHFYPEDVQIFRLSLACFEAWHYGEYNFVGRVSKRQDATTICLCLGHFIESAMKLIFLLSKDYVPYWKWLAHEFRKLEAAERYHPLIDRLSRIGDPEQQAEIIQTICQYIHEDLIANGVITGQVFNKYVTPLLNAHHELKSKTAIG